MSDYTVIGFYESSGQIFAHHVESDNLMGAFVVAAERMDNDPDATMVCALPGHVMEGEDLLFPGEGVVDALTIAEQATVNVNGES